MVFEVGKIYTVKQLTDNLSLPLYVKKDSWSDDFYFRIERVEDGTAYGTAFKNGVEHHRRFGLDYSYGLFDKFVLLDKPVDQAALEQERIRQAVLEAAEKARRLENENELEQTRKESEQELAKLDVSDIVRVNGTLTDKKFLSELTSTGKKADVWNEENRNVNDILEKVRQLIGDNKRAITTPDKPLWSDSETGQKGILVSQAMSDYYDASERNRSREQTIRDLEKASREPYFSHILLQFSDEDDSEDIFVGRQLVYDTKNHYPVVISWRSKLGGLAYDRDRQSVLIGDRVRADVEFRREVIVNNGKLSKAVETFNRRIQTSASEEAMVYDSFLLQVLEQKRRKRELTDIIPSIQRNQYQIIKAPVNENLIVQGCAGCGKTMILLHRISYLLYNAKQYKEKDYLVISPSQQFNRHISSLLTDLELSRINVKALPEYYIDLLCSYNSVWKELYGTDRLSSNSGVPASYVEFLYSEAYMNELKKRVPARVRALRVNEDEIKALAARRRELKNQNRDVASIVSEIERRKRQRRISIFDEEFSGLIPAEIRPGNRKIPNCKAELYATVLLNYYCYGSKMTFPLVFIDEGQDLAESEYVLLRSINKKAVFNIYGDMDQRINNYSIDSWDALEKVGSFSRYSIRENYRNTSQIAEFINDEFMMNMTALGLDGPEVTMVPSSKIYSESRFYPSDRKAIIYKDPRLLARIKESLDGYELLSVNEAKGMEFETVFVILNGMSDNELYVACTRPLNKLYLLDVS